MNPASDSAPIATKFTPYQKQAVGMLAFLQFAVILDFMLMSPLGAVIMPAMNISPSQFGLVVSAYAFSAGASGLLTAGFADRFDRKKLLLFFYTGFILGTVWCGAGAKLREPADGAHCHRPVWGRDWFHRAGDYDRPVSDPDARPRDGRDPDRLCSQPGAGYSYRLVPLEQLELACAVSGHGGDGAGRRPGGGVEDAAGGRASENAAGTQRLSAPVPYRDGFALSGRLRLQ